MQPWQSLQGIAQTSPRGASQCERKRQPMLGEAEVVALTTADTGGRKQSLRQWACWGGEIARGRKVQQRVTFHGRRPGNTDLLRPPGRCAWKRCPSIFSISGSALLCRAGLIAGETITELNSLTAMGF